MIDQQVNNLNDRSATRKQTGFKQTGFVFKLWISLLAVCLIGTTLSADSSFAQEKPSSRRAKLGENQRTEFGARQKLVERKMVELEGQLTQIADRIREKDPKKADRLVEAFQQSREQLITRKMAEVVELLDQNKLVEAEETLDEIVQNLDKLIRLLINQKTPEVSKQQEIAMLEQMQREIQDRIDEQKDQRQEVSKVSDKDAATEKLNGQLKKLDNLIQRQQDAINKAKEKSNAGLRALDKIADEQFEIRKETKELAEDVADPSGEGGEGNSDEQEPGEGEGGKGQPGEGDPKDGGSGEGESGESEPKEGEPKEGKPSESGEGESKPGEGESGEGESGEGESGEGESGDCLLYTSPSPRDQRGSRMPSSA